MSHAPLLDDGWHHPDLVDVLALRERNFRAPQRLYMPKGYEAPEVLKPRTIRWSWRPWGYRDDRNLWRLPTAAEVEAERAIDARLDAALARPVPSMRVDPDARKARLQAYQRAYRARRKAEAQTHQHQHQQHEQQARQRYEQALTQHRLDVLARHGVATFSGYPPAFVAAAPDRLWDCLFCGEASTTAMWLAMRDGRCPQCAR